MSLPNQASNPECEANSGSLAAAEERYRDLFEEAPIAYVNEDLESRFISANRAAQRILGITAEEVAGTRGLSFIPDTPEAQKRFRDAFASIANGTDTSGVILELRRKNDGKPVWIQWWSKPDPSGTHTRTMFVDITDRILAEREKARLEEQNLYLREEIKSTHNFDEIIGESPALLSVLENVQHVAGTGASVLIQGETGTGKELIARAIHSRSTRRDRPLIKINCAALPAGLVESELFGHERGAFSGAIAKRIGRFELANGGTIFLDEVGELFPDVQAKLLRVLQEREFERVGGNATIKVDARVIAATNRDLPRAIAEGKFRQDLFYRLSVFPITLPPLRDRATDIPLLVHFLVMKSAVRVGKRIESVNSETMGRLVAYAWPGNVRELENVVERAVILSRSPVLEIDQKLLPHAPMSTPPTRIHEGGASPLSSSSPDEARNAATGASMSLADIERAHILDVLSRTGGIIEGERGAAKILALHPNTLRGRIKKLGIARPTKA
ncbi:MAG: sigma 54-interacting transcriptional regulator [Polyangiaceae bacterium]|jgi:PAS domain S-box-containing protein